DRRVYTAARAVGRNGRRDRGRRGGGRPGEGDEPAGREFRGRHRRGPAPGRAPGGPRDREPATDWARAHGPREPPRTAASEVDLRELRPGNPRPGSREARVEVQGTVDPVLRPV